MAAQRYLHGYGGTRREAGRGRGRRPGVGAAQPGRVPPRRRAADRRRTCSARTLISSPLTVADCCLVTDGGGAVVLTTLERARDLRQPPVEVLGYGERDHQHVDDRRRRPDASPVRASPAGRRSPGPGSPRPTSTCCRSTTRSPSRRAQLEALGFCGPGEALDFIAGGRIRPGGELAAEHLRRRPVVLPSRPVRRAAAGRGGPPAARRVRRARQVPGARGRASRTAPAGSCPRTPRSCWG